MPGFVPGIHVFEHIPRRWWHAQLGPARVAQKQWLAASRVYPTCGDKPGHDAMCGSKPGL